MGHEAFPEHNRTTDTGQIISVWLYPGERIEWIYNSNGQVVGFEILKSTNYIPTSTINASTCQI